MPSHWNSNEVLQPIKLTYKKRYVNLEICIRRSHSFRDFFINQITLFNQMGDFAVDWSMPLLSQRGGKMKELDWGSFVCIFVPCSKRKIEDMNDSNRDYHRVYWRCPDPKCLARAQSFAFDDGEDFEFSQTVYHTGQVEHVGEPTCDLSVHYTGILGSDEMVFKKFQYQARQYALRTDPQNGLLSGKAPREVVSHLRAFA